ncbi:extensin family protein [Sagittula sp. SSi028]|uniref:extensin-like domain-containing protein n=1 Tax=Sagittula sp. SSi028 TaxID=3400636 RepID=UPI003AF95518
MIAALRLGGCWLVLCSAVAAQDAAPDSALRPQARAEAPAEQTPAALEAEPSRELPWMGDADYAACLAELDALGVEYSEIDPMLPEDSLTCGILRPLKVTSLAEGVALEPSGTMRCETARAAGRWVRDFVLPAAARVAPDRGALTAVRNGSGYVCRSRNGDGSGKPSEHGLGNALDVMGFVFATGPEIAITPREAEGSMAEAFQDAVRASACLEFTTVLGPGSNAAHDDHLHLDVIARDSGYRLCEQGGG